MNHAQYPALFALSLVLIAPNRAANVSASNAARPDIPVSFAPGNPVPFLGVFTHLEPYGELSEKLISLQNVLRDNPHVSGITLKIQWKQLHPAQDRVDWDGVEALIATAAKAGRLVNIALIPGGGSPDWIFEAGAKKAGPFEFHRRSVFVPVPWDERFIELFLADLNALASRYAEDPRIFQIEVLAHNYNPGGEEMHAPTADAMRPFGWSEEKALSNWKFWIDRYAELFPKKKLSLVVSQMYRGGGANLPRQVAEYFVGKCQGRGVLQTHQLQGRQDALAESAQICQQFARLAPSSHEMVGSFKEQPERQGSPEMTVFNAKQAGNLLYLQLWRRDCNEPQYAKGILDAWQKYGALSVAEMKARLVAEGRYVERSAWQPGAREPQPAPADTGRATPSRGL